MTDPCDNQNSGNLNRLIFVMLFIATMQLILFSKVVVVIINYTSRFVIVVICCRATTIFPVAHERKWYFNWFIATYMEQYFRYYIFQGENMAHYVCYGK